MKLIPFIITVLAFLAISGILIWKDHWIAGSIFAILVLISISPNDGKN